MFGLEYSEVKMQEAQMDKPQAGKNNAIELLRIVSMVMIVTLHSLLFGGAIRNVVFMSTNYFLVWFLEIACYGAVNVYGLITGYLCVKSKFKLARIIGLWLQVVALNIIVAVGIGIITKEGISRYYLVKSFFPVISNSLWYFTAYFPLAFVAPYINKMLLSLDKKEATKFVLTVIGLFAFVNMAGLFYNQSSDIFLLNRGQSFLWLTCLYIIGAYLRLHSFWEAYKKYFFPGYFLTTLGLLVAKGVLLSCKLIHWKKYDTIFINYTSPLILLASVCLFLWVMSVCAKLSNKLVTTVAPLTFGVYIMHCHPLFKKLFMTNKLSEVAKLSSVDLFLQIICMVGSIFVVCALVEFCRSKFFEVIQLDRIINKLLTRVV